MNPSNLLLRLLHVTPLCLLPLLWAPVMDSDPSTTRAAVAEANGALPFHPHFPKTLECQVTKDLKVTVRYQTVTFNAEGAKQMEVGKAWHLAGATFETSADLVIGGQKVKAGKLALSARKAKDDKWELVLHEGSGFSTKIPADAHVLATECLRDAPLFEHLNIDVQPAGDKTHTRLHLVVNFDRLRATTSIEVPQ